TGVSDGVVFMGETAAGRGMVRGERGEEGAAVEVEGVEEEAIGTGGTLRGETTGARKGERRAGFVPVLTVAATGPPGRGDGGIAAGVAPCTGAAALTFVGVTGDAGRGDDGGGNGAENVTKGAPEATTTK